jgi:WD40 repeat protein
MQKQTSISPVECCANAYDASEITKMLVDILPALQYIHDRGQLHGDITPKHICWQSEQSRYQLATNTSSSTNPVYSAPEHLQGKPCPASDLYSLGVSCIHLLTGIHPFELVDLSAGNWIWRDYWVMNNDPWQIGLVIDRLIQPDLHLRWTSATAILIHLAKIGVRIPTPLSQWSCVNTWEGHCGLFAAVTSLALNDRWLASASEDKTIRLWDLTTGQTSHILTEHQGFVEAVAFQPGNTNILASSSRDKTIKIWEREKVLHNLIDHSQAVNTVAFSPDGQQLASGSNDRTIKIWNITTGELLATLIGHKLKVTTVIFGNNGILASASADGTIGIWHNHKMQQQLVGHVGSVTALAFSPDAQLLASSGEDRSIRIWDTQTWTCRQILPGHSWQVSSLAFMLQGEVLLSASWDKTVKFWHIATGKNFDALDGHQDSLTCLAIDSNNQHIFTGSRDRTIKTWQITP